MRNAPGNRSFRWWMNREARDGAFFAGGPGVIFVEHDEGVHFQIVGVRPVDAVIVADVFAAGSGGEERGAIEQSDCGPETAWLLGGDLPCGAAIRGICRSEIVAREGFIIAANRDDCVPRTHNRENSEGSLSAENGSVHCGPRRPEIR